MHRSGAKQEKTAKSNVNVIEIFILTLIIVNASITHEKRTMPTASQQHRNANVNPADRILSKFMRLKYPSNPSNCTV